MDWFWMALGTGQWDLTAWAIVQISGELIGLMHVPSVLLRRSRRPVAQLTWILCLLTLPFLGVACWWVFGRTHLLRKRRRHLRAVSRVSEEIGSRAADWEIEGPVDPDAVADPAAGRALLFDDNDVFPTTNCNSVKIMVTGNEAFPAIEAAIRSAREHIHLEFYIWKRDGVGTRLMDLLVEKARAGVEVRLLYDAFGASALSGGRFLRPLQEAGGKVASFLPFRFEASLRVNFRNHRKIVVVDGTTGFTGGLNVGDEYNEWYDAAFRLRGPVVNQLQEVFAEDWYFAAGEDLVDPRYFCAGPATPADDECGNAIARVLPSGPDSWLNVTHSVFFVAITTAVRRVWITTPYFIPDPAIMMALKTAAARGVDVRLLLPGKSDVPIAQAAGRGYFEELLQSGVRIFEYQPSILHAKILIFDETRTIVGSANMDNRSFHLQFEANVAFDDAAINESLAADFVAHLADAIEVTPEAWSKRGVLHRLGDASARLFSPVL